MAKNINISKATEKNWERLSSNTTEKLDSLTKHANKKASKKNIIPKEYIGNNNFSATLNIVDSIRDIPMSVAVNSLCIGHFLQARVAYKKEGKIFSDNPFIQKFVNSLEHDKRTIEYRLALDEPNILGFAYQCLLNEGEKNIKGSYYTPKTIVDSLLTGVKASVYTRVLDPCCGSGGFLLNIEGVFPMNLYGVDIDPIAVNIAKTNLFIKYKDIRFSPNIYCADFLSSDLKKINSVFEGYTKVILGSIEIAMETGDTGFNYIITNPPWGSEIPVETKKLYPEIKSGESYSYFLKKSLSVLAIDGELRFVLPTSILDVKTHKDIRKIIAEETTLEEISLLGRAFTGVFTKVIGMKVSNKIVENNFVYIKDVLKNSEIKILQKELFDNKDYSIVILTEEEKKILDTIYSKPYTTLKNSIFGLGIVTGNNKKLINKSLFEAPLRGEAVYTGKDIKPFVLAEPSNFVIYDRENFQQVASDKTYRAKEKLIYKFISDKLVFAYDDKQTLCLNSANILIPKIEGMSIKTVMAFLNSDVMQFIYKKKFGGIKVLKGNLEQLPFPIIDKKTDSLITSLVDDKRFEECNKIISNILSKYLVIR